MAEYRLEKTTPKVLDDYVCTCTGSYITKIVTLYD